MQSVFISKKTSEIKDLIDWCETKHIQLHAESFISTQCAAKQNIPPHQWIFFGSKNAVACYFEKYTIANTVKVACIGKSTADALLKKGILVDFIGEHASNPSAVASVLKKMIGDSTIVILSSSVSKRSIGQQFTEAQRKEIVLYDTILLDYKLPATFDCYVFTSPSNVNAFLKQNVLPKNATLISWGKSTSTELQQHGYSPSYELEHAQLTELIEILERNF